MTKKDEEENLTRSAFFFLVIGLPIIVVFFALFFFILFKYMLKREKKNDNDNKKSYRWVCRKRVLRRFPCLMKKVNTIQNKKDDHYPLGQDSFSMNNQNDKNVS